MVSLLSSQRYCWNLLERIDLAIRSFHNEEKPWQIRKPPSVELRLFLYTIILYFFFMTWGYLQEKIVSAVYITTDNKQVKWEYPFVLFYFQTIFGYLIASIAKSIAHPNVKQLDMMPFWRVGFTAAIASPIGYYSLNFITYPLMILTKSSKPVPVMLVGSLLYNKTYTWYKYLSVAFVCVGIALFTTGSSKTNASSPDEPTGSLYSVMFGIFLILLNLSLDGVTNNEQDHIVEKYSPKALQMMMYSNLWQAIYCSLYILFDTLLNGYSGIAFNVSSLLISCPKLLFDILTFCICGCVGQIVIYGLILDFGSLVWITISVTRQLFTILLSLFLFNHTLAAVQWLGIIIVFSGLGIEIGYNYLSENKKAKELAILMSDIENDPLKSKRE